MGETDWFRSSPDSRRRWRWATPSVTPLVSSGRASRPIRSGPEPLFGQLLGIQEQAYGGFGPTEDRLHAPDEYIRIEGYLTGAACVASLLEEYPRGKTAGKADAHGIDQERNRRYGALRAMMQEAGVAGADSGWEHRSHAARLCELRRGLAVVGWQRICRVTVAGEPVLARRRLPVLLVETGLDRRHSGRPEHACTVGAVVYALGLAQGRRLAWWVWGR